MEKSRVWYVQTADGEFVRTESPLNEYRREYQRLHPEKVLQWRLRSYINVLKKNGYTVSKDGETV